MVILPEYRMQEQVILVDSNDREMGFEEKLQAHQEAKLHRAFSVFVFNSKGETMLQQRASGKYHSSNLWTNTCCGHPRKGETVQQAAERRLEEEMGFRCHLEEIFHYTYKVPLDNELWENEFLHVLAGKFDGIPKPNPEEASNWKWASLETIEKELSEHPKNYTKWFKISLNEHAKELRQFAEWLTWKPWTGAAGELQNSRL